MKHLIKHHLAPWLIVLGIAVLILFTGGSDKLLFIVVSGVVGCGMVAGGMKLEGWI